MPLTAPLTRTPRFVRSVARDLLLLAVPHGGQQHARRNAWAGMSRDAGLARDRRAAEAAVDAALLRAYARDALADGTGLR